MGDVVAGPVVSRLQTGDAVYVYRRQPLFRHYGLADGNGHIIHLDRPSGWGLGGFTVRRTPEEQFARGALIVVDTKLTATALFSADASVQRACRHLGSNFGGYHLLLNNCEHFVSWAVTGKAVSSQVPKWLVRLLGLDSSRRSVPGHQPRRRVDSADVALDAMPRRH